MAMALELIGWNLGTATLLALVVWLLCRTRQLRRQPAVCHALWILVLLNLVLLPAFGPKRLSGLARLPSPTSVGDLARERCECSATQATASDGGTGRAKLGHFGTETFNGDVSVPLFLLLTLSLVVTSAIWITAARRHRAVEQLLAGNTITSQRVSHLLRNTSRRFGLKTVISSRVVDAKISPMLWGSPRNVVIILPRHLVESLSDDGLRNILAHELAHYDRRDHWTNLFAFAVATLLWWNPIAWLACRQRAAAAEACCDALALERLHGSRKSYAKTLLTVVDSLAPRAPMQSAFGIAFGESHSIRRRFEMIADPHVRARITRGGWLLLAVGVATLVLAPALGSGVAGSSSGGQTQIESGSFCCPAVNS